MEEAVLVQLRQKKLHRYGSLRKGKHSGAAAARRERTSYNNEKTKDDSKRNFFHTQSDGIFQDTSDSGIFLDIYPCGWCVGLLYGGGAGGISGLTDMFDGKVARKFNMITELGKFIDPLADKLTQGALVLCFAVRYPLMRAVLALFILKEGFMGIMGLLLLPRGKKLDGAMWFGKVCTAVLYVLLFILLLFPGISLTAANLLISACGAFMLFSLIMYIPVFQKMWKESEPSGK